ncbi:MAG TPA: ribose 1,5-bisphosphate isomerase, partial [Candidatus Latescibacteria bacterium]|nr:ribose 1,5-bisphosphate isomerase [Candidatus Latescibacterota bacterium]
MHLGGGLSASSAARELSLMGYKILVVEQNNYLGG